MSFDSELALSPNQKINWVIELDGTFFSKHQVDSDTGDLIGTGSGVPAANVGLLTNVRASPAKIDLTRVKTSISNVTLTFKDNDIDQTFSLFIGNSAGALAKAQVTLHMGIIDGTFDFADYQKINDYEIRDVTAVGLTYSVPMSSNRNRFQVPTFTKQGSLRDAISDSATTIVVTTGTDIYQSANFLKIEDEFMQYSSKSFSAPDTTFTGVTRGALDSTAVAHVIGDTVSEVTEIQDNAIEIILQLLLSGSGTSIYDTLHDGLEISDTLIDVTAIEAVRDDFFIADDFRLYLYDIENTLTFMEKELLQPNNLRFVDTKDGISLAVLDQSIPGATLDELNPQNILKAAPTWKVESSKIINQVTAQWDFKEGTKQYREILEFNDAASQAIYGIQKNRRPLKFKGIQEDLGGTAIITDRMNRYLARFSTPQVQIGCKSFLENYKINEGDKILFSHPKVVQEGGGLGIFTELEVVSKAVNFATGVVGFNLVYTSYFNVRRGLIAPFEAITVVTDQKTFAVANVDNYEIGYFLKLWNITGNEYHVDAANPILSINRTTKVITMTNNFATTLTTTKAIKFADYDEASALQRARYASVAPNTGFFLIDGAKAYQILI